MALFESIKRYLEPLEGEMRAAFPPAEAHLAEFYGMLQYHLGWVDREFRGVELDRGKQLRPALCLISCEAAGGDFRTALPFAAALELLHNFSLIHDDIEDASDQRRHRPTVWNIWGLAQGLNAGDGMFAVAHLPLARLLDRGVQPERVVQLQRLLDRTALTICEGQYLDLRFESRLDITPEIYLDMIGRKTAALIATCAEAGASIATDDREAVSRFRRFGYELGMAFQLRDDVLGIWGRPEATGKPAAADVYGRKKSLPLLYALEQSSSEQRQTLTEVYGRSDLAPRDADRVIEILDTVGAARHAKQAALARHACSVAQLNATGCDNPAVHTLRELADTLLVNAYWPPEACS